jgi:cellobiose-specific phosphotransferase system component IIA
MKKIILLTAGFGISIASMAQKSEVRSAINYLNDKEYDKAKKSIEAAVNDDDTKNDAKTWYIRGVVYLGLQAQPANQGKDTYYKEATKSFLKSISLDPKYEAMDMNLKLNAVATYSFNDGINAFRNHAYADAYNYFGEVITIRNVEEGKRLAKFPELDTIARQSSLYQGYSAYYSDQYDKALDALQKAKTDPVVKDTAIYTMLADIYDMQKKDAELSAIIAEGRSVYPTSKALAIKELNYYIKSGRTAELVGKLEEAVAKEPDNADLLYSLGGTYDNLANPKDKTGADLPKPAEYETYFGKAEKAYADAAKNGPGRGDISYSLGALYFNRAVLVNEDMNKIVGTSAAEMKQYDALKNMREGWFNKALPYLEQTYNFYSPNAATLAGEDRTTYMGSIIAMKEIYAKQNKLDKSMEMKKKLEEINK